MGAWLEERDRKMVQSAVRKTRRETALDILRHMFERRIGRELTKEEQRLLAAQLRFKDPAQLSDIVLDMSRAELLQWLKSPE